MGIQEPRQQNLSMALLIGMLIALVISGCSEPGSDDGRVISEIVLPTDTLLNLYCPEVGVVLETCVLDDPENPYRTATIREFDVNDPDAETKFDLADKIPAGPTGAKARFYLWATALARFPSGENQYFTAQALHELWDAARDPVIQEQALKAYRAVLDNFFGSVTFFVFSYLVDGQVIFSETGPPPNFDPDRGDRELPVSFTLNELTADNLYRQDSTGWAQLVPGDPVLTLELISEWGYTYTPCTVDPGTGGCSGGVISVSEFP